MNPKKTKERIFQGEKKKKVQKNSAIQKPTTAVRQTESKRIEGRERERSRGSRRQYETWLEKREEQQGGAERVSVQLCI